MNVTKEELDAIYINVNSLEDAKKDIASDIKDALETFAKSHDLDVKSIKKYLKERKEYDKNKDEYIEVDWCSDSMFQIACPELASK